MDTFYNTSIAQINKQMHTLSGWKKDAAIGYVYMRDGTDYVNNKHIGMTKQSSRLTGHWPHLIYLTLTKPVCTFGVALLAMKI